MNTASLARSVGRLLAQSRLKLAVAESCTGGLLGAAITSIPGSSSYFEGGIIAYSYEAKAHLLGVPADTLQEHGAVSPATVKRMAHAVRKLIGTDLALAITGIAGPGGATPSKPVGLVYIALSSELGTECTECRWSGNRKENQEWSVRAALELLYEHLMLRGLRTDAATMTDAGIRSRGDGMPDAGSRIEMTCNRRFPLPGWNSISERTPIPVEARFDPEELPLPLAFKVQGQWLSVASVGRAWSVGRGREAIHRYTVDTPSGKIYELAFEVAKARWILLRSPRRKATV